MGTEAGVGSLLSISYYIILNYTIFYILKPTILSGEAPINHAPRKLLSTDYPS